MKFTDISNERTILDEDSGPYGLAHRLGTKLKKNIPLWGKTKEKAKGQDAVEAATNQLWKKYLHFTRGQDPSPQEMQRFFIDNKFGKSGQAILQAAAENLGDSIGTEDAKTIIKKVVDKAYRANPQEVERRMGTSDEKPQGFEGEPDKPEKSEKKQKAQTKEFQAEIIDKLGQALRQEMEQSTDEETRAVKNQAYRAFRNVAAKYGRELPEA
jgi:hypothetical protein